MAIEAVRQIHRERHPDQLLETIALRDVSFVRALIVPDLPQRSEMKLSLNPQAGKTFGVTFRVVCLTDGEWREYCKGSIEGVLAGETQWAPFTTSTAPVEKAFKRQELYLQFHLMSEAGNSYGPTFAGIRRLILMADASFAVVVIPNVA